MLSTSGNGAAPTQSEDFDEAYRAPLTLWGDVRIPTQLKALAQPGLRSLELGCGIGRLTRYLASAGLEATGVDFSPVAISRAQKVPSTARFLVSDVTRLDGIEGPFDLGLDVGCFHCLSAEGQRAYAAQVHRVLRPRATHLIWALDASPADLPLNPETVATAFKDGFTLRKAEPSRRRLVRSHWYWLERAP